MTERRPGDVCELVLVRLIDASLPFRMASRAGDWVVALWRSSASAALIRAWLGIPLERRVRLVSAVLVAAILTHLTLTRIRAPEPTWLARATWVAWLLALAAVGTASRGVAAAWTTWRLRLTPSKRRTS